MKIYAENGLPFYTASDINARLYITDQLSTEVIDILMGQNRSWCFKRIEAPILIPPNLVSSEYSKDDYYTVGEFHLRPETTAASYAYAKYLNNNLQFTPPTCIWQLAKSFRKENDQVSKNMRFKEFYQLEFQCIYTEDTKNDYQENVLEPLRLAVQSLTTLETRIVKSDRLPSYSLRTMDIEVKAPHKWLEVCSISLRNDAPFEWNNKKLLNLEIAFGADRLALV